MDLIRCLIADVPQQLLGDIVKKVVEQDAALELVGDVKNTADLPRFVEKQSIDVLIVGVDCKNLQQLYDDLIKVIPDVLVFGLIDDGRGAMVYLEDIGVDEMLQLITSYGKR